MATITYNNNNNWVVPGHTGTVTIEVWGAGGGGGSNNRSGNNAGGGGGGGAYARSNLSQLAGANLSLIVGAGGANGNNNNAGGTGGTSNFNNNQVKAVGGGGGATVSGTGGSNGLASGGVGQVGFNGGNGASKVATGIGGGGGSSGGNAAVGRNGQGQVGGGNGSDSGNLPAGAGAGGNGGGSNANGANGVVPGGGAGGAGNNVATPAKRGGVGAIGQVTLTWTPGPQWMEAGTASTQDFSLFVATGNSSGNGFTGTAGTGTLTSSSQAVLGSVRSIAIATGASNGSAGAYAVGLMADTGRRVSFGFRFHGTPAPGLNGSSQQTAGSGFCSVDNNGLASVTYYVGLTSGFKLVLMDGLGAQLAVGTTTLSADTDYRISFAYVLVNTTNNNQFTLYLNGIQELSATNVSIQGVTGNDTIAFNTGDTGWTAGSNLTYYISHIYIDTYTSGDTGEVRVTAKLPLSNGTTNNFTGSGTPSSYGTNNARYVNYRPLQTITANVNISVSGTAQTEEYNVEDQATGDINIPTGSTFLGYLGWINAKSSVSETASLIVNGILAPIPLTSTTTVFTGTNGDSAYPAGTGSDIGLTTTTATATVTMYDAGMEVAYISPTPASSWLSSTIEQPVWYNTAIGV